MIENPFVGAWKLVSYELQGSDGRSERPLGERPLGQLMYDAAGNMMGHCVDPDRPPFKHPNPFRGTPEEMRAACAGCIAYFGAYEWDPAAGTVTHRVRGSLFPNWNGTAQVRSYRFEGRRLVLRMTPVRSGEWEVTPTLVWERVG